MVYAYLTFSLVTILYAFTGLKSCIKPLFTIAQAWAITRCDFNHNIGIIMADKPLSKNDLAACLVENCKQYDTKIEALKAVNAVFGCLERNLGAGEAIMIPGFGKFTVNQRAERQGRNPKTGEAMTIKASKVVSFKSGALLKQAVNS
jgi:DNA-binding protein HU-beta